MTDAPIDEVPADFDEVDRKLAQAENHLASAEVEGIDSESAYIILYSAVHKALSAALLAAGRRVGTGERGHVILIQEARRQLGGDYAQLLTRIDRARRKRNRVAYEAEEIGVNELHSLKRAARQTLDAVRAFSEERRF